MRLYSSSALSWIAICFATASSATPPIATRGDFGDRQDLGLLAHDPIDEASGIAASRRNANVFWVHNDSGNSNELFALNESGEHLGVYTIAGATSRDWEDIAAGPGPVDGMHYLYIGEIGDNDAEFATKTVYRIEEPIVDSNQTPVESTLFGVEALSYQYPDGFRDAETLMLDPLSRDLFIVSKREDQVRVYRFAYPQSSIDTAVVSHIATLNFTFAVGGDISPTGSEVLIKTREEVYYWSRLPGQSFADLLSSSGTEVPYDEEPKGEAICWGTLGEGYYTTSEESGGEPAHLYFYPRESPSSVPDSPVVGTHSFSITPNPFRQTTRIDLTISQPGSVSASIYGAGGRLVKEFHDIVSEPGHWSLEWNGLDASGRLAPSGSYYLRLSGQDEVHRLVLLR